MGYSLSLKGYKCLDPKNHRVYISGHVLFNKGLFPFSGIKEQGSQSSQLTSCATLPAKPPLLFRSVSAQHNSTQNQKFCPTGPTTVATGSPSYSLLLYVFY